MVRPVSLSALIAFSAVLTLTHSVTATDSPVEFRDSCSFTLRSDIGPRTDEVWSFHLSDQVGDHLVGTAHKRSSRTRLAYSMRPQRLRTARMTSHGSDVDLAVTFFDLESDKQIEERRWHGERTDDRWVFTSVPTELDVLKREVTYSINLWKVEDDDEARRARELVVAEEAKAKAQWLELRPRLEALRTNGHFISSIYAAEGGKVEWIWSDSNSRNYQTVRIRDYARIKELNAIPYVPLMTFEGDVDSTTFQHLKELNHIGLLNIDNSAGLDLSTLIDRPQIDSLSLSNADSRTIDGVVALRGLDTLEIWFRQPNARNPPPFPLDAINRLTKLKHLALWNVPGDSPDVLVGLHDLQSLRSLTINALLGEHSLSCVSRLNRLEQLDCLLDSPERITQIKNPHLQTLRVAHSSVASDMNDDILLSWNAPASLRELGIGRFWTPTGHLAYVRELPEMLIEKRKLFATVRSLPELRSLQTDLEGMRPYAIVIGGGFINSVVDWQKPTARKSVIETLQRIDFNQDRLRTEIPQIAKAALVEAKSLLDQKKLSNREMTAVVGALSPYYIEDDEEVWRILHPEPLTVDLRATQVLAAALAAMGYNPATSDAHTYSASWSMSRGPGSLPETRDIVINVSSRRLSSTDSCYDFSANRFDETFKLVVNGSRAVRTLDGNPCSVFSDVDTYFEWSRLDLVPQKLAAVLKNSERLSYAGQIMLDGRSIDRIQLVWHKKVTDEFDFDANTHLLVERRRHQTEDEKRMFEGKFVANGDYTWKYENYERHAELMIPMTVTVFDPIGVSTEIQQCTEFAVDPKVSDTVFAIP